MGMQGGDPLELEKLEKLKKHQDLKVEELEILKNELKMKRTWQVQPALGRRLVGWVISLCRCLWTVTETMGCHIFSKTMIGEKVGWVGFGYIEVLPDTFGYFEALLGTFGYFQILPCTFKYF